MARWQGSASLAAHERIRFLGGRTDVGADALSGLPKVLTDYAQALRDAQARYAAGQLARAIAAEKAANAVATAQVTAITGLMAGMSATVATGPSPAAADRADGYRAKAAPPQAKGAGTAAATMAASTLPDPRPGDDPQGRSLPRGADDAERKARAKSEGKALDAIQTGMDLAGMIPVVGVPIDLVNAGIYALRGQWGNAALSGLGAVPIAGDAATAVRLGIKGKKAIDAGEVAAKLERAAQARRVAELEQHAANAPATRFTSPPSSLPPTWVKGEAKPGSGEMWAFPPKNPTAHELLKTQEYATGAQKALDGGGFHPGGRVSGDDDLRAAATDAARNEKNSAAAHGTPYRGHAGHVPDTTWGGEPEPHSWADLPGRVNTSLGGQASHYPEHYQVNEVVGPLDPKFIGTFGEWTIR